MTEVPGIAVHDTDFEELVDALLAGIGRLAAPERAVRLGVPPVISREILRKAGYTEAFPHLLGSVHARSGPEWTEEPTDVAVLPAACYHVYPRLAGAVLAEPRVFDLLGHCYRHEATSETGRLRSFRMRELVRVDATEPTLRWRDEWIDRARDWLVALGLRPRVEPATDPFFGAADRLMGAMQRAEGLKWELIVEVDADVRQAVISCNSHKDHFAEVFGFRMRDSAAQTACVAFGIERLAFAVRHRHGIGPANWPDPLAIRHEYARDALPA